VRSATSRVGDRPSGVAALFLDQHPEFAWEKAFLRDVPSGKWTEFRSAFRVSQAAATWVQNPQPNTAAR
jgi:hypothetical protein